MSKFLCTHPSPDRPNLFRGIVGVGLFLALVPALVQRASTQGAGPAPILVVVNTVSGCTAESAACNPFGRYLGEILRAEGINSFDVVELASLQAATLESTRLVVLAETALSDSQAGLLASYVQNGGRLVAMRPDARLAPALNLVTATDQTTDGYVQIDTGTTIGAGLPAEKLPFRGTATHYGLGPGAQAVASLHRAQAASTFNGPTPGAAAGAPAVVRSGRTATWAFDLARSVAYVRQGNPALAGAERDGVQPIRTTDVFYGTLDLDRLSLPHADIHMRLFARVVQDLLEDALPLPRAWYFPGTSRGVVIVTGDEHNSNNLPEYIAGLEARGARGSLYVVSYNNLPDAGELATLRARGHEFGMHPWNTEVPPDLNTAYQEVLQWFTARNAVPSRTARTHQVIWDGWVEAARTGAAFGVALDVSFYTWGPAVRYADGHQAKGFINGSGLPMRFVDQAGTILPVYQQVTSLIDEQLVVGEYSERLTAAEALAVSRQLIDASRGGGDSAIVTQFHADFYSDYLPEYTTQRAWTNGTIEYASSVGVPLWTAERWLRFTEARAAAAMTGVTWQPVGEQLTFSVTVPAGAEPVTLYVPWNRGAAPVTSIRLDGSPLARTQVTVAGRAVAMFSVPPLAGGGPRTVAVKYGDSLVIGNHAPVAVADQASTAMGTAVTVPVLANDSDVDGDILEVAAAGPASGGTVVVGQDGRIVYTPIGAFCGPDAFPYTVTDGRGGSATATVTVTVACTGSVTHTTVADFSGACAVPAGTRVTSDGGGAVSLAGVMGDSFAAPVLGPQWVHGPTAPLLSNGVLTVNGTPWTWEWVRSAAPQAVTTLDARARFTTSRWQHVGWADLNFNAYLIFSTGNTDGSRLQARSAVGGAEQVTDLGPLPGGFHDYRIERPAGSSAVRYYLDGALVAEHTVATVPQLYAYVSRSAELQVDVDHLWVHPPYVASGTFDGCAVDAGGTVSWRMANWNAAVPAGTALQVATRTSSNGVTWSAWSAPLLASGGAIASAPGRFLQYRLLLTSGTGDTTPALDAITVSWGSAGSNQAPVVTNPGDQASAEGATLSLPITAADPDGNPLLYSATGLPSGLSIDAATGVIGGTVAFGAAPANSVVVTASDGALSGTAAFTWTVTKGNRAPVAQAQAVTTAEDTAVGITLAGTDADGDPLTYAVAVQPAHGTLSGTAPNLTYTPAPAYSGPDSFTFTVNDGTIDSTPATVSITVTSATVSVTHTTVADFSASCAAAAGTRATLDGGGAVALTGAMGDDFAGASLGPQWTHGPAAPLLSGGVLTVAGTPWTWEWVRSAAPQAVTTLDARARFTASRWQHVGWADLGFNTYLIFSTGTTDGTRLQARSALGGPEQTTDLGPLPSGFHDYRIERPAGTSLVRYYLDGALVAEHTVADVPAMHVYVSRSAELQIDVDHLWVHPPYVPSGTFDSCPVDAGLSVTWQAASWEASAPAGSSLQVATRTSVDGLTWSDWSAPLAASGSAIASPPGRYLQYRLALTSATGDTSPLVGAVTVSWDARPPVTVPALGIGDVVVTEGNTGTTNATFTVTLSEAASREVTVAFATADGTATAGSDYVPASGTVTIPAGQTTGSFSVAVAGDTAVEPDETFAVNLSGAVNASLGRSAAVGTIVNDDVAPTLEINDVSLTEGNTGSVTATFTVTLSAASGQTITVNYATANNTATAGTDYVAASGTLTFAPGVVSRPVTVSVIGDVLDEADETFSVVLSGATNAALGAHATGVGTIADNDASPSLTINNVTVTEGNTGTVNATFTVRLSAASGRAVSVGYATADGTATAGSDYVPASGTLTIPAGSTTATLVVPVIGDTVDELSQTFFVNLGAPVNATIADGQGLGTITDNDATPSLRISDVTVAEGNGGSASAVFTVTLTGTSDRTVTVQYATANNTATAGSDYTASSGTLSFAPGTPSQTVTVAVLGDLLDEVNESFYVNLSGAVNATIADSRGIGTVTDDDPTPSLVISDVSVTEGNAGTVAAVFRVSLSAPSGRTVTVRYATANNTAVSASDYAATSGTLTFPAGTTELTVSVLVNGDTLVEASERFYVNLSGASAATIADSRGICTIVNDDI